MTGDQLNGTNRFVADGFLDEKACKVLRDLAKVVAFQFFYIFLYVSNYLNF